MTRLSHHHPSRGRNRVSINICDTEITSNTTSHTVTAHPVPGQPATWTVSWLPGHVLTRNEAITAMTIAEATATPADPWNTPENQRLNLQSWAAELGLTADEATAMASKPRTRTMDEALHIVASAAARQRARQPVPGLVHDQARHAGPRGQPPHQRPHRRQKPSTRHGSGSSRTAPTATAARTRRSPSSRARPWSSSATSSPKDSRICSGN